MADSLYLNTVFTLNFDDADGDTTTADMSAAAQAITPTDFLIDGDGGVGGGGAGVFNGSSTKLEVSSPTGLSLAAQEWCLELSAKWDGVNNFMKAIGWHASSPGPYGGGFYVMLRDNTFYFEMGQGSGTWSISAGITLPANTWTQFELRRIGDTLYLHQDGNFISQQASPFGSWSMSDPDGSPALVVGHAPDGGNRFSGALDRIRLTVGSPRARPGSPTDNFTPDTDPFEGGVSGVTEDASDSLIIQDFSRDVQVGDLVDTLVVSEKVQSVLQLELPKDSLVVSDAIDVVRVLDTVDPLVVADVGTNGVIARGDVVDQLVVRNSSRAAWLIDGVDPLQVSDATDGRRIFDTADALVVADVSRSIGVRTVDVLDTLVVQDRPDDQHRVVFDSVDLLVVSDALDERNIRRSDVVDALVVADAADARARVRFDTADALEVADAITAGQVATLDAVDRLEISDALLEDALMAAWVMNAGSAAMSRYSGLPYNSVAMIAGRVLAVGPGGFYELAGDSDGDAQIDALARSGKHAGALPYQTFLGDLTVQMQSPAAMSISITTFGRKAGTFKYLTTGARAADTPTTERVKPGKGLCSVYYQFDFENTGGARLSLLNVGIPVIPSETRKAY